jgi:hypothetical protein
MSESVLTFADIIQANQIVCVIAEKFDVVALSTVFVHPSRVELAYVHSVDDPSDFTIALERSFIAFHEQSGVAKVFRIPWLTDFTVAHAMGRDQGKECCGDDENGKSL